MQFQIGELANTLTSKMEFLGINKKTISNFHLLLLQTEVRILFQEQPLMKYSTVHSLGVKNTHLNPS